MFDRLHSWIVSHADAIGIIVAGSFFYAAFRVFEMRKNQETIDILWLFLETAAAIFVGFMFCIIIEGMGYPSALVYGAGGLGGFLGPKGLHAAINRISKS